ncbi:MAG TPA: hypothetical protein VKS20_14580 [Candidatus Acidoferrales bacterium]|nr:hypothetical protein [Candidatus Acidoferrales bacterium]
MAEARLRPAGSKQNPFDLRDAPLQSTWWTRIVVVFGMFGIAALGLFPRSRVASISKGLAAIVAAPLKLLRPLQSGRVGDYVAWFAFGIAAYGGILLFLMR